MHKYSILPARHQVSQSSVFVACSHLQLIYNQTALWPFLFVSYGLAGLETVCWCSSSEHQYLLLSSAITTTSYKATTPTI